MITSFYQSYFNFFTDWPLLEKNRQIFQQLFWRFWRQKAVIYAQKKWELCCPKMKQVQQEGQKDNKSFEFNAFIHPRSMQLRIILASQTLTKQSHAAQASHVELCMPFPCKKHFISIESFLTAASFCIQEQEYYKQREYPSTMTEEKDRTSNASLTLPSSNSKSEVEMRRDKKKKLAAFKTFLDNKLEPSPLQDLPARRKLSQTEVQEQKLESNEICKICSEALQQGRLCEFCRDNVCASHLKKRRRNPQTNKWTRICEFCEDKYLMEKHYQNQMKTEESLITQEAILRNKHAEMADVIASKRIKLQMLNNKRNQLIEYAKKENARLTALQNDADKRWKRLENGLRENGSMQLSLTGLEKILPASLQADYAFLQEQNARITGDLVRYQKLCIDAVKARSQREREMYEEYYQWEEQRREELQANEKKEEECIIY